MPPPAGAAIASAPNASQVTNNVQSELTKSYDGAADIAKQYPQYLQQIVAGAKQSFVHGDRWAFASGAFAVALGAILVFFPKFEKEKELARGLPSGRLRPRHSACPLRIRDSH